MRKICFVVDSMNSGGAERVIANLSNYFVKNNIDVSIVFASTNTTKSFYKLHDDVKMYLITEENKKPLRFFKKIKKIKEIFKKINPDYILTFHTHITMYTYLSNRKMKTKHIVSERNDPGSKPKNIILKYFRNYIFKKSYKVVFQTKDAMAYFGKEIARKSTIISNPVILEKDYPLDFEKREKRIVAVGRLVPQKNFALLLNTFSIFSFKYPEYTLEIYGSGNLKDELIELSKKLNILDKVIFKGSVKNLHDHIYNAGMYIMTSDYEGFPNALIEAMSLGIPSISSDCPIGGPKSIIDDHINGMLFPVNNKDKLFEIMVKLHENKILAKRISINGRRLKEKLSIDIIGNQWLKLFEN